MEHSRRLLRCIVPQLAVVLACALMTGESRAGLVLAVDPVAMTYQLNGMAEFTPFFGDDSDFGQWGIASGGSFGALTSFDSTFATASPNGLALTRLRLFDTATDLIVDWGVSGVGQQQVFGNGQIISYAGASVTQKSYFESIIGQSLTPIPSLSAEPIPVVSVPEPTSLALLGLAGAVLLRPRRWRR
ncbi:PEP-CTERM sorting domain-containing protein [Bythopirellula polymerisocia]|uniref:PEP-CTERM sorting domain-containing protein n=1 Tax=Bythopirellula polymerisocia TaxID=2528003 RepID=UPI0018D3B2DC|nr:PEP-CTERM sorting domain-containing protein [Bythopirellula polymerisocia]